MRNKFNLTAVSTTVLGSKGGTLTLHEKSPYVDPFDTRSTSAETKVKKCTELTASA